MSSSEIISFRLNADQIAALEALGEPGETKQAIAKRIVIAAIGGTPQVSPVPQDALDNLRGEFIDRMNTQSGSINEVLAKQWQAIAQLREEIKALQLVGIQSYTECKPTEEISPQEPQEEESIQVVYNCVQKEEVTPQEENTPGEEISPQSQYDRWQEQTNLAFDAQRKKAESHNPDIFRRNYRIIRELLECQYFLNEGAKHGYSKEELNQNKIRENIKTHKSELEELLETELSMKASTEILFNKIFRAMGGDVSSLGGGRFQITNPDQLL
ncbi:hypothetical protein [Nodularia spumigena]|uniref:hypothetical protein n=1 Tax=Nodularia spumigena TaxID=70799 RepID=UPI002B1EAB7C|nr:hypothetical protein [Nodularia spumigena]MEA5559343.1 hypothetical protein [Nodularia spumigena CH309]